MSEREHHIKVLENLLSHYKAREKCEGYYDSTLKDNVKALEYAISSLKTDEAYQIMYEGGEVFTKDDVVAMMTELQMEIEEMTPTYHNDDWSITDLASISEVNKIIQQKIDAFDN